MFEVWNAIVPAHHIVGVYILKVINHRRFILRQVILTKGCRQASRHNNAPLVYDQQVVIIVLLAPAVGLLVWRHLDSLGLEVDHALVHLLCLIDKGPSTLHLHLSTILVDGGILLALEREVLLDVYTLTFQEGLESRDSDLVVQGLVRVDVLGLVPLCMEWVLCMSLLRLLLANLGRD